MRDSYTETEILSVLSAAHFLKENVQLCRPYPVSQLLAKAHKRRFPKVQAVSQAFHRLENKWLIVRENHYYRITKQGFFSFYTRYFEQAGPAAWLAWLEEIGKWAPTS